MQIRLASAAEQDLQDGFLFYEMQQQTLGSYFLDSVYADIDSLILYAGVHAKPLGRFHRALAKRFPICHLLRSRRSDRDCGGGIGLPAKPRHRQGQIDLTPILIRKFPARQSRLAR